MDRPLCCCCFKKFGSLRELEDHSFAQFLKFHTDNYDICGTNIWFCYGCRKYFRGYDNYRNHFKWLASTPKPS